MIKIIGGKYKGTNLLVPDGKIVRPTLSLKKEAIFNILTSYYLRSGDREIFSKKIILDAFAGCGGLGLEALSRGSNFCYFIEKNKIVENFLKKNCSKILKKNQFKIINIDFNNLSSKVLKYKIDIVFFDPPYEYNFDEFSFKSILIKIKKNAIFVLETDHKKIIPKFDFLKILDERIFKKTKITLLKNNFLR